MNTLETLKEKSKWLTEKQQREVLALVDAMLDSVQKTQDSEITEIVRNQQ